VVIEDLRLREIPNALSVASTWVNGMFEEKIDVLPPIRANGIRGVSTEFFSGIRGWPDSKLKTAAQNRRFQRN